MILIADSGATKTDWLLYDGLHSHRIKTEGINPFHMEDERIIEILREELYTQIQGLTISPEEITDIYFYGAGCLPTCCDGISKALHAFFPDAIIQINTDLLGAARALCCHHPGIACILGTGANSCLYDGEQIQKNISPLGYILGDEGSGAYLGKRFVSDCFKEQLPSFLREGLLAEFKLTYTDIIDRIYRKPLANRFLASLTPYIYKQKEVPEVHAFLTDCFDTFFRRNVLPYQSELPVSFTGSISWYFQDEVKEAASNLGLQTALFLKNPIEGMAEYHGIEREPLNNEHKM